MGALMKATAYATHRGVGKSAVSNWKKAGLLVYADDGSGGLLIDVERTDARVNANVDPTRGRPTSGQSAVAATPPPAALASTLQDDVSKVRTDLIRAQTTGKNLDNARRAGALVPLAEFESRAAEVGRLARERMHSIVRQACEQLAAERDPRQITAILTERIDEAFTALADQILGEAADDQAVDEELAALPDDLEGLEGDAVA